MYFISSRQGSNAFSQYNFVFLTAIDILTQHPVQAKAFLHEIRSSSSSKISPHPLDRCHDLFFLNTIEHFAAVLPVELSEDVIIAAATPYLGVGGDSRLIEIFEAAHSAMLAVLAAPQNHDLLVKHLQSYLEVLFQVFPQNISSRQFRLAVRTLVDIMARHSAVSEAVHFPPSILLELVRQRLEMASPNLLHEATGTQNLRNASSDTSSLSEQSVLVLTLVETLAYLPIGQLQIWLPLVAESLVYVQNTDQRQMCTQRFWQLLSDGEMDTERAALCLTWWTTNGGREMVLGNPDLGQGGPFMNGGLQEHSRI